MTQTGYAPDVRTRLDEDAAQIVARYPQARSALLPLLHLVQSQDGYVSRHGIEFCAETLGLTTASVSAVATFYTQYKRRPNGEFTVGVCTNTLCAIMGGDEIFERLSERLGVGHDETTADGKITLERWVELTSTTPARMFGLYGRKGVIQPGADADIVVYDPNGHTSIGMPVDADGRPTGRTHHMNMDHSAWEGFEIDGHVDTVLSRGTVVVDSEGRTQGAIVGETSQESASGESASGKSAP